MSRRMSCALTVAQVLDRSKTVTRRHVDTWQTLKPGDQLTLIEKGMGLPKGARQVVLATVTVVDVRDEPLGLVDADECAAEGFPGDDPLVWRWWWAKGHGYIGMSAERVDTILCRRIEWRYNP